MEIKKLLAVLKPLSVLSLPFVMFLRGGIEALSVCSITVKDDAKVL